MKLSSPKRVEATGAELARARQGRLVAIVIACAGLLSIFAPNIARLLGGHYRLEMLLYLMSLAAFIWSLVVTWNLWQKTKQK